MASGIKVGSAYIEVTADSKGAMDSIARDADRAGSKAGSQLGENLLSGAGSALNGVGKLVLGTAGVIGGIMTAGAAKGGFDRLLNIDQAQFKLKGLGYSAQEVEGVMSTSLNAVKGTAFGLGDAVGVAAGALAAGVPQGAALERTLKLMGDTAAIAGTDLGEMGQIFNQISAVGKLTTEDMQQLQGRGIPVLQYLADMYGVTSAEAQKMVSEGKVSFEDFQTAIETNIGGAALKMGESWSGGLANMKAALSRVGATVLTPLFSLAGQVFNALTPIFDAINNALKPAMEQIGAAMAPLGPKLQEFAASFAEKIGPAIERAMTHLPGLISAFGSLAPVIGIVSGVIAAAGVAFTTLSPIVTPLMNLFKGMGGSTSALASRFSMLLGPIGLIGGLLIAAYSSSEPFRNSINSLVGTVMSLATTLLSTLMPVFTTLMTAIMPVVTQVFNALVPVLTMLVSTVGQVVSTLGAALIPIIQTLISAVLPPLMSIFQAVIPVIMQVINGALVPLVSTITGAVMPIIQALLPIVTTVFSAIGSIIQSVMGIVQGVINVVLGVISGNWGQVWNGIKQILTGVWDTIKSVISGALSIVQSVISAGIGAIKNFFSSGFNAVKSTVSDAFSNIVNAVSNGINNAISFVAGLPGKALNALGNIGSILFNSGTALIQGFIDGIKNMAGNIAGAVGNVLQSARDLFPFSPAKEGPFSGRGYTTFSGKALAVDFAKSIEAQKRTVQNAAAGLLGGASSTLNSTIGVSGAGASTTARPSNGIISNNNEYHITIDAKNVKEFNDVVDIIQNIPQVARTGRGTGATARIA